MSQKKKRVAELDIIRGITISLVVLGHTAMPDRYDVFFSHFRMPLFFIVSGYLFSLVKYESDVKLFFKNKLMRLVLPYFSACFLLLGMRIGMEKFYQIDKGADLSFLLFGIFNGNGKYLVVDGPAWFLICLFMTELFYLLMARLLHGRPFVLKFVIFAAAGAAGAWIGKSVFLPWNMDLAMVAMFFLFIGNELKRVQFFSNPKLYYSLILLSICIYPFTSGMNDFADMNYRKYGNLFLFYLNGVTGAFIVFFITRLFTKSKIITFVLSYIGRNSINLLLFHVGFIFYFLTLFNERYPQSITVNWGVAFLIGVTGSLLIGAIIRRNQYLRLLFNGVPLKKKHQELEKKTA
ncbi:acyltransferase family protein [Metabacillus sp. 113a]|uniref:acyltransferase family protein n=1 Tax=Metabacillus sp. 113a TaxID=3404706 RepID=UPI003CF104B4